VDEPIEKTIEDFVNYLIIYAAYREAKRRSCTGATPQVADDASETTFRGSDGSYTHVRKCNG
jgi:hypothetical protein